MAKLLIHPSFPASFVSCMILPYGYEVLVFVKKSSLMGESPNDQKN